MCCSRGKSKLIGIITEFEHIISDVNKGYQRIFAGYYDNIASFLGIGKVHKKVPKIRTIIRSCGTITEISGQIGMELIRKIIYRLKFHYPTVNHSMDDIRNIVIKIKNINQKDIKYSFNNTIISSDIKTMYDSIWKEGIHNKIEYSINHLLPPNYMTKDELNLFA